MTLSDLRKKLEAWESTLYSAGFDPDNTPVLIHEGFYMQPIGLRLEMAETSTGGTSRLIISRGGKSEEDDG